MTTLSGLRILVVEDEAMIAMLAEDMLELSGARVVAVAPSLAAGREAVEGDGFDLVLLDVNLGGETSDALADRLQARGIPFIFTTGYGAEGVDARHATAPVLAKPYLASDLEEAIIGCLAQSRAGDSSMTSTVDSKRG